MPHATKSLPTLWRALRHNPLDWQLYDKNASLLLVPTACGGASLADIQRFYGADGPGRAFRLGAVDPPATVSTTSSVNARNRTTSADNPLRSQDKTAETKADVVRVRKILHTLYTDDTVVEESVVDVTLVHAPETESSLYYAWLVPGLIPKQGSPPITISIAMVNIVTFDLHFGRLLSRRVYWDQASVLKQLGLLHKSNDATLYAAFVRHPQFELPVVGIQQVDAVLQPSAVKLNTLASKYNWTAKKELTDNNEQGYEEDEEEENEEEEDVVMEIELGQSTLINQADNKPSTGVSTVSKRSSPKKKKSGRAKGSNELADRNQRSQVFDERPLPANAFSGIAAHPNRYSTQNGVFSGNDEKVTSERVSPLRSSGKATVYDDRGATPLPRMHDPTHHHANLDFTGPKEGASQSDPSGQSGSPRRRTISNREHNTTLDKDDRRAAIHKKPNPALEDHFKGSAAVPDADPNEIAPRSSKQSKPEFETTLDKSDTRIIKKPNPALETSYDKEGSEATPIMRKARPAMETSFDKEGSSVEPSSRPSRPVTTTTLDKDAPKSAAKPRKDLQSHLPFTDKNSPPPYSAKDIDHTDIEELTIDDLDAPKHARNLNPDRLKSNLAFTESGTTPAADAIPDKFSQRRQNPVKDKYSSSIPFVLAGKASTENAVPARGHYMYHNKSGIEFGDDGGDMGLPPDVPRYATSDQMPKENTDNNGDKGKQRVPRAVGGKTSIQLG